MWRQLSNLLFLHILHWGDKTIRGPSSRGHSLSAKESSLSHDTCESQGFRKSNNEQKWNPVYFIYENCSDFEWCRELYWRVF